MSKLKTYQEQVQEAVEKAVKTIEEQHRAVIAKPFEFAEKIEAEARSYSVKDLRAKHDKVLDSLYSSVLGLNTKVNTFAQDLIAKFETSEKEVKADAKKVTDKAKTSVKRNTKTATRKVDEAVDAL
ncbi:hypothetical protein [Allohahella marinimesophila]|uniref:Phasin domain-containing protein n=1 Tax=Allohahella marinimesophila TaxID=1054972 RepID=A0ABP7PA56_9GAMM